MWNDVEKGKVMFVKEDNSTMQEKANQVTGVIFKGVAKLAEGIEIINKQGGQAFLRGKPRGTSSRGNLRDALAPVLHAGDLGRGSETR